MPREQVTQIRLHARPFAVEDRIDNRVAQPPVRHDQMPTQHAVAARNIAAIVAPGGTLLVLATTRDEGAEVQGPPWPLTRTELEEFATGDLVLRRVERIEGGAWWRVELVRGAAGSIVEEERP